MHNICSTYKSIAAIQSYESYTLFYDTFNMFYSFFYLDSSSTFII